LLELGSQTEETAANPDVSFWQILLQKSSRRGARSAAAAFEGDREPDLAACPIGSGGLVSGYRRLL
jgi:hypothetical protein